MPSMHPVVLETANVQELLQYILKSHASPSTLLVCTTKATFLESLQHMSPNETGAHDGLAQDLSRLWRTPTLRLLSTSRTLKLVFCSDITHVRAYLATYSLVVHKRAEEADTALRHKDVHPILAVLGLIQVHRPTTAFSAQGLNRTISVAIEAAHDTGSKLILAECAEPASMPSEVSYDMDAHNATNDHQMAETAWNEEVPILNVTTKRLGELSVGRTVSLRTIAQRWCTFERLHGG